MANELKHGSVGTELTQAEWEAVGTHVFASQAAGDIMYASSTSQLSRLGKGADNTVLHLASGIPAWSATLAGLTLTTPTISSTGFANANHAHAASNSGGTVAASALSGTSLASGVVTTSATTVGVLNSGSINTGFGNIDNGSSTLDTGAATVASLDVSNGSLLNVGNASSDWDSTSLRVAVDTFSAATKHLVVGHTATVTGTHAATFEILGTGLDTAQANIGEWSADAYGPAVTFIKSRHASIGSNAIVQDNDLVGRMIYMPDDGTDFQTRAAQFHAEVDDASPEANGVGMAFVWSQMPGGGTTAMAETMRIAADGTLYVGDTSNVNMTTGLTINQGAADNEILALKSSDVAHGMTDLAETDTYARLAKMSGAAGGLHVRTFRDSGTMAIQLDAFGVSDNTDKTSDASTVGYIGLYGAKKNGVTAQTPGADANLVTIHDGYAGTTRFIFDIEGSAHADVEWVAYADHDDIALMNDLESEMLAIDGSPERTERRHMLEAVGIIGKDSWHIVDGRPKAMVNQTKLAMLHHGALLQVGQRITALEEENTR